MSLLIQATLTLLYCHQQIKLCVCIFFFLAFLSSILSSAFVRKWKILTSAYSNLKAFSIQRLLKSAFQHLNCCSFSGESLGMNLIGGNLVMRNRK